MSATSAFSNMDKLRAHANVTAACDDLATRMWVIESTGSAMTVVPITELTEVKLTAMVNTMQAGVASQDMLDVLKSLETETSDDKEDSETIDADMLLALIQSKLQTKDAFEDWVGDLMVTQQVARADGGAYPAGLVVYMGPTLGDEANPAVMTRMLSQMQEFIGSGAQVGLPAAILTVLQVKFPVLAEVDDTADAQLPFSFSGNSVAESQVIAVDIESSLLDTRLGERMLERASRAAAAEAERRLAVSALAERRSTRVVAYRNARSAIERQCGLGQKVHSLKWCKGSLVESVRVWIDMRNRAAANVDGLERRIRSLEREITTTQRNAELGRHSGERSWDNVQRWAVEGPV